MPGTARNATCRLKALLSSLPEGVVKDPASRCRTGFVIMGHAMDYGLEGYDPSGRKLVRARARWSRIETGRSSKG